jgi:hypothetical protein
MMGIVAALALGISLSFGSADTPTDTIDSAALLDFIDTPKAQAACDAYRDIRARNDGLIDLIDGDDETAVFLVKLIDSYLIVSAEGDTTRLTPEARKVFVFWLHAECRS